MTMSAQMTMSALMRSMQRLQACAPASAWPGQAFWHLNTPLWATCSSSSSNTTTTTRCHSSDTSTSTSSGSSSQQHLIQSQQQPHEQQQTSSPFSTAPDAFTRSLQSKTEQEVFSLLERARAAKLAEAAAAAKAAAKASGGTAATAAAAAEPSEEVIEGEEEDDTVDVINPETGEVRYSLCKHLQGGGSAFYKLHISRGRGWGREMHDRDALHLTWMAAAQPGQWVIVQNLTHCCTAWAVGHCPKLDWDTPPPPSYTNLHHSPRPSSFNLLPRPSTTTSTFPGPNPPPPHTHNTTQHL